MPLAWVLGGARNSEIGSIDRNLFLSWGYLLEWKTGIVSESNSIKSLCTDKTKLIADFDLLEATQMRKNEIYGLLEHAYDISLSTLKRLASGKQVQKDKEEDEEDKEKVVDLKEIKKLLLVSSIYEARQNLIAYKGADSYLEEIQKILKNDTNW